MSDIHGYSWYSEWNLSLLILKSESSTSCNIVQASFVASRSIAPPTDLIRMFFVWKCCSFLHEEQVKFRESTTSDYLVVHIWDGFHGIAWCLHVFTCSPRLATYCTNVNGTPPSSTPIRQHQALFKMFSHQWTKNCVLWCMQKTIWSITIRIGTKTMKPWQLLDWLKTQEGQSF